MSERRTHTNSAARRTALLLTAVALTFYLGFILIGVLNS